MKLLIIAIAPALFLLIYISLKDKYEREPLKQLIIAYILGALVAPITLLYHSLIKTLNLIVYTENPFNFAFIQSSIPEELFKFLIFVLFIYKKKDFNEWFDGIVYASALSLGFATAENVLYVFSYGAGVGYMRAFTSVPLHFIAGVTQGFFFGLAKFRNKFHLFNALFFAILVHGFYNLIVHSIGGGLTLIFVLVYLFLIYRLAKKMIGSHLEKSPFKNLDNNAQEADKEGFKV